MVIDLSRPLYDGMPVYPGDPAVQLVQEKSLKANGYTAYTGGGGFHAGTHLDAPMHLTADERFIGDFPAERFIAPGVLLADCRALPAREIPLGAAVLLETGMDARYGETDYYAAHPQISDVLCEYLISRQVALVGLDAPSPDLFPFPVHKRLLDAGIFLLENLTNLSALRGKAFTLIALPLPLRAEASPVRAVALL